MDFLEIYLFYFNFCTSFNGELPFVIGIPYGVSAIKNPPNKWIRKNGVLPIRVDYGHVHWCQEKCLKPNNHRTWRIKNPHTFQRYIYIRIIKNFYAVSYRNFCKYRHFCNVENYKNSARSVHYKILLLEIYFLELNLIINQLFFVKPFLPE